MAANVSRVVIGLDFSPSTGPGVLVIRANLCVVQVLPSFTKLGPESVQLDSARRDRLRIALSAALSNTDWCPSLTVPRAIGTPSELREIRTVARSASAYSPIRYLLASTGKTPSGLWWSVLESEKGLLLDSGDSETGPPLSQRS